MVNLYLHPHNLAYLSQVLSTQKLASTVVVGIVQVIFIFVSASNYVYIYIYIEFLFWLIDEFQISISTASPNQFLNTVWFRIRVVKIPHSVVPFLIVVHEIPFEQKSHVKMPAQILKVAQDISTVIDWMTIIQIVYYIPLK